MKRILLSALAAVPLFAMSQTTIFTENFDTYNDQDWAGDVSSVMSTWSGVTGAGSSDDVPVTSAESSSPSNSVQVTGPQAGGSQDAMVVFPSNYTAGRYEFSMKYKVASGMGGYFNLQSDGAVPGTAWLAEIYFDAAGAGYVAAAGQQYTFNYTNGAWIDVVCVVDIDSDMGNIWIEGVQAGSGFVLSLEADGTGTGANMSFGGINLYSASGDATAACEYYVDDLMLVETTGVGLEEEVLNASMNVVPNPSNGNFVLDYTDMSMENATVTLVDILGKTIYSKKMSVVGNASLPFNMNLRNGVYFVTVTDGTSKLTKKIIVKK
jgi:hypothetical protein